MILCNLLFPLPYRAVVILDDILLYEDMDQGMFRLDHTIESLDNLLALKWNYLIRSLEAKGYQVYVLRLVAIFCNFYSFFAILVTYNTNFRHLLGT